MPAVSQSDDTAEMNRDKVRNAVSAATDPEPLRQVILVSDQPSISPVAGFPVITEPEIYGEWADHRSDATMGHFVSTTEQLEALPVIVPDRELAESTPEFFMHSPVGENGVVYETNLRSVEEQEFIIVNGTATSTSMRVRDYNANSRRSIPYSSVEYYYY
jgi:hypothetical protein